MPVMSLVERAAREAFGAHSEAQGAHQDTGEILKMLRERYEETDPLGAITEGQLLTIDRQKVMLELLGTILEEVRKVRTEQERHGLEMQALRTAIQTLTSRCDETYALLVRATQRPVQAGASPKSA